MIERLPNGWESGMSGDSWFKVDKYGTEWQAYVDEEASLVFRIVEGWVTGPSRPMTEEEYEELFG